MSEQDRDADLKSHRAHLRGPWHNMRLRLGHIFGVPAKRPALQLKFSQCHRDIGARLCERILTALGCNDLRCAPLAILVNLVTLRRLPFVVPLLAALALASRHESETTWSHIKLHQAHNFHVWHITKGIRRTPKLTTKTVALRRSSLEDRSRRGRMRETDRNETHVRRLNLQRCCKWTNARRNKK